jgi:hypothetical protein
LHEWDSKVGAEECPKCGATGSANIGYSYYELEPKAKVLETKAEDKIKPKSNLDLAIERVKGRES